MDATNLDRENEPYTTSHRVQAWFLGRSRDKWKDKYKKLKADAKRLQNRVNDVTASREQWKQEARQLKEQLAALQEQAALKKSAGDAGGGAATRGTGD